MPVRFSKVDDNLYRGGAPSPNDLAILKDKYNVHKIVSLDEKVADRIAPVVDRLEMEHIILPMTDGHGPNVDKLPEEVHMWTEGGPTYVHCFHGKDRTSMACAAYRILINGWDKGDAILEAYKFGMGRGLSPKVRNSYYEAVYNIKNNSDSNDVVDIVMQQRDFLAQEQHQPAINDQAQPSQQNSFAPYLDVEQNHLFYRGSRADQLIKLATGDPILLLENLREQAIKKQAGMQIFKYGPLSQVLLPNKFWATSMIVARQQQENESTHDRMYVATIDDTARILSYPQEPTETLVHSAMMLEADAVIFNNGEIFIINPAMLINIKQIGGTDSNNATPVIGLFDNYVGLAQHSYPGSSGFMGGAGGAGLVETGNSFQL